MPQTEETPLDADLLPAARAGDGEAFKVLVGPNLRALHVHAYRMLGSLADGTRPSRTRCSAPGP